MKTKAQIIFSLWLLIFINYMDRSAISFAGPAIMSDLSMNAAAFGIVLSSFGLGYALALVPGGIAADRWGARWVLIITPLLWGTFTGLTGFVTAVSGFIVMRLGLGISEGLFSPSIYKSIGDHFEPKQRAGAIAICISSLMLGPAVAGPTVALLIDAVGWQGMFMIMAVPAVIASAVAYLMVPKRKEPHKTKESSDIEDDAVPMSKVIRRPSLWVLSLSNFTTDIAQWGFLGWMPTYLFLEREINMMGTGFVGSVPYVFGFVGLLLGGWLGSTFFHRYRIQMVTVCYVAAGLSLGLAYVAEDLPVAVIGLSATAFFLFGAGASKGSIAIDLAPANVRGTYIGIYNVAGQIGATIAPATIGFLVHATGKFALGFGFMIFSLVVTAICMIALMPLMPRSSPPDQASAQSA